LDPIDEVEPGLSLLSVGFKEVDQEKADLLPAERLQDREPVPGERLHPLGEGGLDLALRHEVLSTTGEDDFGVTGRRLEEGGKMIRRLCVGHPQGELVEAIEEEGDAALFQHVAKLVRSDLHSLLTEMLADEGVEVSSLFEGAHLEKDGDEPVSILAHSTRQLLKKE